MGLISKTDIIDGRIIVADFFRRIIEAFDGTRESDIHIRGEVKIHKDKLKIDNTVVNTTADDLNGLANRTKGITNENKPLIVGEQKELDYLRVNQLAVNQLLEDAPSVANSTGKIYSLEKFY